MRIRHLTPLSILLFVSLPSATLAQWQPDGAAICTETGAQVSPTITPDGAGGAIVAWTDFRSGTSYDIYAQRIAASGLPQWTANGVALCTAASGQGVPRIVSDGAGGAIVAWQDYRNGTDYDIYAQRINASGAVQWTANGVALCAAANNQPAPTIVPDGTGGAIVAWQDYRNGANYDIYAQRINASGAVQWTANGAALCTAANSQHGTRIVSDGAGGAIATWQDARSGTNYDVYTQRINASGAVQWIANGVALCTAAGDQSAPTVIADGVGGTIVTWQDGRNGATLDIYAQRIDGSGAAQWTANGVALCAAANNQYYPTIASDGAGGAIVTWFDIRNGTNFDIYAQRVNASGAVQWTPGGAALCKAASDQSTPTIVPDGVGGAIVTWDDTRSGTDGDIYAQRINTSGTVHWTANGIALCSAANGQYSPVIASDGAGGAIVTWFDERSGINDIYAQRVTTLTSVGAYPPVPSLMALRNYPNPFSNQTELEIGLPGSSDVQLEVYDVAGRRVRSETLPRRDAGWQRFTFDARNDAGQLLPSGVYFYRVTTNGATVTRKMVIAR